MNIFLLIFAIVFVIIIIRRIKKGKDSEIINLLCPFCDSYIARAQFPSKTLYLMKSEEDLWLGGAFYCKVKIKQDLYIVCPNCYKLVILEEKKICSSC